MQVFQILLATLLLLQESNGSRVKRQAMPMSAWPNAVIPINFASNYPDDRKASVRLGMTLWQNLTCVRFTEGSAKTGDWVEIIDGSSCQSSVGNQRIGRQTVILGELCNGVGSTAHELGHAIGLQHMQTRPDRDQYITVMRERIYPGMYSLNYGIERDSSSMGFPYDYSSLLHYGPYEMSMYPNLPAIIPKDPAYNKTLGNYYPSFYDVSRVNAMYKCDSKCSQSSLICLNNGVIDVNDCTKCRCPSGWGGLDCSQEPKDATVLTATESNQNFSTTLGDLDDPMDIDYDFKHIVIKAPIGRRIRVEIKSMWAAYDILCKYGGLEIFTKEDTRISPPRVCALSLAQKGYESDSNRMYIRLFKRIYQVQMNMNYRLI